MARAALLVLALSACAHRSALATECARGPSDRCVGMAIDMVLMEAVWSEYDDPALAAYVSRVGDRLVRAAGRNDHWTFRVIDTPAVNAEANLATTVYVTRGALARLRSEAELAGLLGHEIGHVLAGHSHETLAEMMRDVPRTDDARALRAARDDEIQADELAVLLAWRAGYDPRAVETMLRAIAAGDPPGELADDPHPPWTERLARVHASAAQLGGGELGEARYRAAITGLVVGEDPRRIAAVDRALVLARAGLAIDLPASAHGDIADGTATITLGSDRVTIQAITTQLASHVPVRHTAQAVSYVERAPHGAAYVSITGPHALQDAAILHRARRLPHARELARVQPQRLDLAAPRRLWPE